jgi:GT2 family glycosyltransferase
MKNKHFVTAIIVSHNGALWLPEVVASIAKQRRELDQVIAIDTGSDDSSVKLLKSAGIHTVVTERETGFGAAINQALAQSKLRRAPEGLTEWLWLIHDDCAPAAHALSELLSAVDERPSVAMAGPKLRGWHDRNHLLEVGVSIAGNGARWTGLEYREQDQGQHDNISEVLAVSTAGALVRRDVFEELGGFDPELSLFRDEVGECTPRVILLLQFQVQSLSMQKQHRMNVVRLMFQELSYIVRFYWIVAMPHTCYWRMHRGGGHHSLLFNYSELRFLERLVIS